MPAIRSAFRAGLSLEDIHEATRIDRWFLRNRGVLPDGRPATMINVMKQLDDNSFTWQTIERTAGEELLPNIDEIQIVRRLAFSSSTPTTNTLANQVRR